MKKLPTISKMETLKRIKDRNGKKSIKKISVNESNDYRGIKDLLNKVTNDPITMAINIDDGEGEGDEMRYYKLPKASVNKFVDDIKAADTEKMFYPESSEAEEADEIDTTDLEGYWNVMAGKFNIGLTGDDINWIELEDIYA